MRSVRSCGVLLLVLLASTAPSARSGAGDQRAATTWAEHRANLQTTIREIESGQMLWVPDGNNRLMPVRREDYTDALVASVVAPLYMLTQNRDVAFQVPSPEDLSRYRRLAREAVVSTEAFRRALVAELEQVERYLNSDSSRSVGGMTFDPRSPERVRDYLRASWELELKVSTRSPDFRPQADLIAQSYGSVLEVTEVKCNANASSPDFNCALIGRVVFRGSRDTSQPVVGRSMIESLRMASFTSEFGTGGGRVRFAISAAEAGGNLEFSGTLSAETGRMQDGTMTWSSSRGSERVGTWSATRGSR